MLESTQQPFDSDPNRVNVPKKANGPFTLSNLPSQERAIFINQNCFVGEVVEASIDDPGLTPWTIDAVRAILETPYGEVVFTPEGMPAATTTLPEIFSREIQDKMLNILAYEETESLLFEIPVREVALGFTDPKHRQKGYYKGAKGAVLATVRLQDKRNLTVTGVASSSSKHVASLLVSAREGYVPISFERHPILNLLIGFSPNVYTSKQMMSWEDIGKISDQDTKTLSARLAEAFLPPDKRDPELVFQMDESMPAPVVFIGAQDKEGNPLADITTSSWFNGNPKLIKDVYTFASNNIPEDHPLILLEQHVIRLLTDSPFYSYNKDRYLVIANSYIARGLAFEGLKAEDIALQLCLIELLAELNSYFAMSPVYLSDDYKNRIAER